MTLLNEITLAIRLAMRDMRGGARALRLLVAGVFIGTASVALIGVTTHSIADGARQGALETVGGDLSLRLFHRPATEAELSVIRKEGAVSVTAELRPMVRAIRNGYADAIPLLSELKGVDGAYPHYGHVGIIPDRNLHQTLNQRDGVYGAVADKELFNTLGLKVGDSLQIGEAQYQLRGTLVVEPDRAFRAFTLGPRIIVSLESLPATNVSNVGSATYFYTRVKLPAQTNGQAEAEAALSRIDRAFPQSGWRMVNAHKGVPGVERTLAMANALLLFIGLGVMLVGGAGIVGAVLAHVAEKTTVIAILKSIGAPPHVVTLTIGFEVMFTVFVGVALGVGLGAFGPALAASALAEQLPFALETTPAMKPMLAAGLFGILVALLFAWWPLMGVQSMNARVLLRQRLTHTRKKLGVKGWIGVGLILSTIVALVFWVSPLPVLTVVFLSGALVLTAIYYALGIGLIHMAKVLAKGKSVYVRQALSNLYRSGSPTGSVVMALGLTMTFLVALDGIGSAARNHLHETLPHSTPDLVAFSIAPEVATHLENELAKSGMTKHQRFSPFLHARVQAIGGIPVQDLKTPASLSWVIRGDRGVSFATTLPDGTRWNASQSMQPGFSIEGGIAEKLGLGLGDTITLNVSGDIRSGEILKFHYVDWSGLNLDFPLIATPATFSQTSYTFAASLKANSGQQDALEAFIKQGFPNVPLIRVSDVLQSLSNFLNALVIGLETAASMCGLAALVVLAGSVLQGLRERINEAALLKVLGARKRQLMTMLMVEFLGLGTLVALVALPLGLSVAYAVARVAEFGSASVSWTGGIMLALAAISVTLLVGLVATLGAYSAKPARVLLNSKYV